MTDLPLITKIHGAEVWTHRDQTRPAIYLKVQAGTETGQLVLSLSIDAAKQLTANLEHILREKRFQ